jgi:acetyl-CoA synthetase/medium-chain acyl-CoA synthetase
VAVIDDEGNALPPGSEGDIAVRTAPERPVGLFREYWRNPGATAAAHRGDWYVTGDRARVDEDGYFWFVGRADDVIISAGYRIGPFEVESALVEHPAVAEAAVVGKADELRGTVVKAFVILVPGRDGSDELARELQEHVRSVTAPYKYPREVEFVAELPKTISGKIRRIELRSR